MSLRWRLTAAISALVIAAIAILGVVTTRSVTRSLEDRIDFQLRAFRATPEPRGGDRPQPVPDDELIAPEFDNPAAIVIEFDRDLRVRDSTPNDVEDDPDRPEVDAAQLLTQRNDPNLALTVDAVDGSRRYRIVLSPNPRDGVTVYALPLDDLDATVEQLRERFLVGGAVVVLLVIAAIWWVTKRALRPVDDMVAAADQIGAGRLDARIPTESTIPEVSTLGASLNAMLTEIELSSREREEAEKILAEAKEMLAKACDRLEALVAEARG